MMIKAAAKKRWKRTDEEDKQWEREHLSVRQQNLSATSSSVATDGHDTRMKHTSQHNNVSSITCKYSSEKGTYDARAELGHTVVRDTVQNKEERNPNPIGGLLVTSNSHCWKSTRTGIRISVT